MELYHCDLPDMLPNMSSSECYIAAEHILCGMQAFEKLKMVHCDVKPENAFMQFADEGRMQFAIGDLGCAVRVDETVPSGTPGYYTPEFMDPNNVKRSIAHSKHDIYSIGIIMFKIIDNCHVMDMLEKLGIDYKESLLNHSLLEDALLAGAADGKPIEPRYMDMTMLCWHAVEERPLASMMYHYIKGNTVVAANGATVWLEGAPLPIAGHRLAQKMEVSHCIHHACLNNCCN